MASNLRDLILAASDLPTAQVETSEWAPAGVPSVTVRGLTASERDQYEQSLTERTADGRVKMGRNVKNLRAGFVARVIVDESGERVFTDKDIEVLGEKNAAVIDRLWTKGRELSGMSVQDEDENPSTGDQDESPSSD